MRTKTLERVDQMTAAIQDGQGTIGKLLTADTLYTKVNSVTGRLDDVLAAVQDQKGTTRETGLRPERA